MINKKGKSIFHNLINRYHLLFRSIGLIFIGNIFALIFIILFKQLGIRGSEIRATMIILILTLFPGIVCGIIENDFTIVAKRSFFLELGIVIAYTFLIISWLKELGNLLSAIVFVVILDIGQILFCLLSAWITWKIKQIIKLHNVS